MRTLRGWLLIVSTVVGSSLTAGLPMRADDDSSPVVATVGDDEPGDPESEPDGGTSAGSSDFVPPAEPVAPVASTPTFTPSAPSAAVMPTAVMPTAMMPTAPASRGNVPLPAAPAVGYAAQLPVAMQPAVLPASPYLVAPAGYAPAFYPQYPVQPAVYGPPQGYPMMAQHQQPMPPTDGGIAYGGEGEYYGGEGGYYGGEGEYYGGGMEGDSGYFDGPYGEVYAEGVLAGMIQKLLPYSEGGRCAPRWYDIGVDAMYLRREQVGSNVGFTAASRWAGPPNPQDIVISTNDLDFNQQLGLRFNAAVLSGPGSSVEFSYFGLFNWSAVKAVADPTNNLFSIYTNYGFPTVRDEVDQAQFHSVGVSSTLDNFEVCFRRRWTGPNCRTQGSWSAGARYIYLIDDLQYYTLGRSIAGTPVGQSNTLIRARNSLTGFQMGGDLWTNLVPGVSLGADLKGGLYGNYAKQNTSVLATTSPPAIAPPPLLEEARNNDLSFVGEANFTLIYRTSPHWTLRAGYSLLYIDNVALSVDNFNPQNPFAAGRTVRPLQSQSNLFYHGAFAGVEWNW